MVQIRTRSAVTSIASFLITYGLYQPGSQQETITLELGNWRNFNTKTLQKYRPNIEKTQGIVQYPKASNMGACGLKVQRKEAKQRGSCIDQAP